MTKKIVLAYSGGLDTSVILKWLQLNYDCPVAAFTADIGQNDNFDEIREYELRGGGGTDFECIFKHMKENLIEPEKLIVFTDGYPWNSWGDPLYADTLWVIHGDNNPNPPFGQFVLYDK